MYNNRRNSKERELMKSKNLGKNENPISSQSPNHSNRPTSPKTTASNSNSYIIPKENGQNNLYSEDFNHQKYAQQSKISLNCCINNNQNHYHNSSLQIETSNDQAQSPSPSDVMSPNSSSLCMSSPVSSVSSTSSLSTKSRKKNKKKSDSIQLSNNEPHLLMNEEEEPDNTNCQFSDDESNFIVDSEEFNESINENEISVSRDRANSTSSNTSKND